jgi:hypothetical protein
MLKKMKTSVKNKSTENVKDTSKKKFLECAVILVVFQNKFYLKLY